MDEAQGEGFVRAAERDYRCAIDCYCSILGAEWHWDEVELREARADVLAARQLLDLARNELRWQQMCARQREAAHEEGVMRDREGDTGYHWGSVESTRVDWPYSMAGLAELHEHTVARVLRGEVAVPSFCAQCRERAARQGCMRA